MTITYKINVEQCVINDATYTFFEAKCFVPVHLVLKCSGIVVKLVLGRLATVLLLVVSVWRWSAVLAALLETGRCCQWCDDLRQLGAVRRR